MSIIAATYRKTRTGEWVIYGPADLLATGRHIPVSLKSGATKTVSIESVGKTFDHDGVAMCYGYAPREERAARPARHSGGSTMCENCGERRATTTAHDMSGIYGRVCRLCASDPMSLSYC